MEGSWGYFFLGFEETSFWSFYYGVLPSVVVETQETNRGIRDVVLPQLSEKVAFADDIEIELGQPGEERNQAIHALRSGYAADIYKTRPSGCRRAHLSGTGLDRRKSWEDMNGSA